MVIKSKKSSFSSFYNKRQRELRRASEADGQRVARGSDSPADVETSEKGSEPEFIHDRDRTSTDEQAETNEENDSNSASDNTQSDDEI